MTSLRLECDCQDSFMRTACPEKDGVDRIARRLYADEAGRNRNVIRAYLTPDDIECFERNDLCSLNSGSGRRAQSDLKLRRISLREQFCAEPGKYEGDDGDRGGEIRGNQWPSELQRRSEIPAI